MPVLRNLDLAILALALPVFALGGLPVPGWLTAAGVWVMWRGVGELAERRADREKDPRRVAGLMAGSMIARGWALGLILVAVGLGAGDDVGLSAAILAVVLFTVRFTLRALVRPSGSGSRPPRASAT
ncbi:MAG: hypothetical protein MSC31_10600 [Solirubrobacteraceae bacterium MAG38_C4-C5]|nr:hypothetical protein [Candidatus Siliceabacter maunaloa]